jgi:hypothetical protein
LTALNLPKIPICIDNTKVLERFYPSQVNTRKDRSIVQSMPNDIEIKERDLGKESIDIPSERKYSDSAVRYLDDLISPNISLTRVTTLFPINRNILYTTMSVNSF